MGIPSVDCVDSSALDSPEFDGIVVITSNAKSLSSAGFNFNEVIANLLALDEDATESVSFLVSEGRRIVLSPTGPLNRDYDDVRRVGEAATAGVERIVKAGSRKPLLFFHEMPSSEAYKHYVEVGLLQVLQHLYQPLQARETSQKELEPVERLGFVFDNLDSGKQLATLVTAIESGRRIARDVGGSDAERMAAPRIVDYLRNTFQDSGVSFSTVDAKEMEIEYPLALAVGRASLAVPRHHPSIVRLDWKGEEETTETLVFAGKGVVYDTGGADIKVGGSMMGMSLDKCGAANVAGFVKAVSILKPKHLRVIAELGFVRNSCGSDSFVSDEVITGHSGVRVKIVNTDAEGRLVMSDCLSHLRQRVLDENLPNPRFMTCATLTGHAVRSVGSYTIAMDNGPARTQNLSSNIQKAGELFGEIVEISYVRRDDFSANRAKNKTHDCLNLGDATPAGSRGHQLAAAFLTVASGLDKHGLDSDRPMCYTHFDIAGSAAEKSEYKYGKATGSPIISWTAAYVVPKL